VPVSSTAVPSSRWKTRQALSEQIQRATRGNEGQGEASKSNKRQVMFRAGTHRKNGCITATG
jgi:hypothetical protein